MPREPFHRRLFRALLRLFPAEFRGDFGEQMAADFEDQRREVSAQPRETRRLWFRTVLDLAARAPREHLDALWRDVVYALRSLRRHKASTAVAVFSLAIGIGLNAAVFSVVHGVLWRELPFPDGDRLVQVGTLTPGEQRPGMLEDVAYHDAAQRIQGIASLAGAAFLPVTIVEPGEPVLFGCSAVTANFFDVVGTSPILGRTFTPAEYAQALGDREGKGPWERPSPRVMMLSHALWLRLFGGSPDAVGTLVTLAGGDRVEVVGVAGRELESSLGTIASGCWTPGELPPPRVFEGGSRFWNLSVLGRLEPDVSIHDVQAGLNLVEIEPRWTPAGDEVPLLRAVPLRDVVVGEVRTQLTLLFGAVVCVLLVTCANVASLLLARASGRRDELATRAALGATRGRLVRQSLTEALVMSAVGGAVGLFLALWTVPLVIDWAPTNIPRLDGVGVNWRTLLFSTTAAVVIGVCCGLLSALTARQGLALQPSSGRATPRVGGLRQGLVVAEIAVALVLVVGATLMVRTVRALGTVDLGFDPSHVISAVLPGTPQEQAAAIERVKALPGVVTAGVGGGPLDGGGMFLGGLTIPGDARELDTVRVQPVTPGYLEALSVRVLAGRLFEERDLAGDGPSPIVINRTTARQFFGDIDALDRTLMNGQTDPQIVVGVIADLREASLEAEPGPGIYQVATRSRNFSTSDMVIKVDGDPDALIPPIRSIVRSIDPEAPFRGITPLQDNIDREMAPRHFVLQLIGLFSALGLALAVIGVYGVIAESVTQRVPEIGVRMAFGATTGNVMRLVLRQGWRLAVIGVLLGLAGAAALNGTMRAQVYGVGTLDPVTYAVAALCLILATVAACLIPARRAARLDPVAALRAE